jgi:hypothetical protein
MRRACHRQGWLVKIEESKVESHGEQSGMADGVACTEYGALVLRETAEATGGLCRPCKGGFRKKLEEGKRWHEQRKAALANPDPAARH